METYKDEYLISTEPWYKRNIFNWILYDLGNTIFSMVVVSITLLPVVTILYYSSGYDADNAINKANFSVSTTLLIGNVLMAIISPFLGAYSDQLDKRKNLLIKISILCIILMGSLTIVGSNGSVLLFLTIFLFANMFYQAGLVIYDAMLPFITDKDRIGKVGAIGIAVGYFGSVIGVGLGYVFTLVLGMDDWYTQTATATEPEIFQLGYIPNLYPVAAVLFFLFMIPMFFVKEKPVNEDEIEGNIISVVKKEVIDTAKEVVKYRDMLFFIFGWLIFVDVANTVIFFMTQIIAIGLGFGEGIIVQVVLGIGIISAVLFTYIVGIFVDKYGPKIGLYLVMTLWTLSMIIAFFTNLDLGNGIHTPKFLLYIFPIIVGPALGGTWVVQRTYVTQLAPPEKIGNYFGFSNIFGRISAAIGPFVWSSSIWLLNKVVGLSISLSTRIGLIILILLMFIGFIIIHGNVSDVHAVFLAGGKARGDGTWADDSGNILYVSNYKKKDD